MKRYIITAIILVFFGTTYASSQNAKQFYKVGEQFFENKMYDDAIEQFTAAINFDPEMDKAYLFRAQVYEKQRNYASALLDYNKLCIFDEGEEEYFYKSAEMSYNLKDYSKCLTTVEKALKLNSSYSQALELKFNALFALEQYAEALDVSKRALRYKESEVNFYNYGRINEVMGLNDDAIDAYTKALRKNSSFLEVYVKLADLYRRQANLTSAMETINNAIGISNNFIPAYEVRSAIYSDQLNYTKAIEDISTILSLDPSNTKMFFLRGKYYQGYAQHMNAITDFTKVISLDPAFVEAYFNRAQSYEQVQMLDNAINDYKQLALIAEDNEEAMEMLAQAEGRLFELNRENKKPKLVLSTPEEQLGRVLHIPRSENVVPIVGTATDDSEIKSIKVNDLTTPFTKKDKGFEFLTSVNVNGLKNLKVEVTDVYDNTELVLFDILRTEVEKPVVKIIAPYASDNNVIYLDTQDPMIYVEGVISDESLIKGIYIDGVVASYVPSDLNPTFGAMISIKNKNQFTIKATDGFGNVSETTFSLNRESANLQADNPMGKTWVVFIENSNYQSFASLEGPTKDILLMKTALANYSIHNFIHKKDMTKQDMERFFAIELRDLLSSNRVNSLLVWYAGHGKFVNETGYWVPVDAKRDDEFTYFNINALKASMQSYPTNVNHTLIITDACESGPSFYQAMRSGLQDRNCNDVSAVKLKSSQVFSSAGYELAVDNSQFTRTFANSLANNVDACIPIESIVQKVTDAVVNSKQQKPQFGKIAGLEDENGTFFFITK
ncbi:MAG: caspase family protein [Bacteroidales bacterium]|nr:caspase family protein [Bacteroidales bacterium]MCF8389109.1 caspase family protein [Bacteroidales bacterium]